MKRLTTSLLLALFAAPAAANNFSYTTLGFSLGVVSLDDDFVYEGEAHDTLGQFSFEGSYQFGRGWPALTLNATGLTSEEGDTEVNFREATLGLVMPFALGDRIDVAPEAGSISTEQELCLDNTCVKDDDSGLFYGIGLRAWAVPDQVEVSLGWADSTLDDSNYVIRAGSAFWWGERHSLRLDFSFTEDSLGTSLGYRHSW